MGGVLCRATDGRHKNPVLRAWRAWPLVLRSTFAYTRTVLGRVNGDLKEADCYIWTKKCIILFQVNAIFPKALGKKARGASQT